MAETFTKEEIQTLKSFARNPLAHGGYFESVSVVPEGILLAHSLGRSYKGIVALNKATGDMAVIQEDVSPDKTRFIKLKASVRTVCDIYIF